MAFRFLAFSLAIALAVVPVHGGSRSWESSISYARVPAFNPPAFLISRNSTNTDGSSLATNINNHKRWVAINPGSDPIDERQWPDGTIKYCFEAKEWSERGGITTKQILFADLEHARDRWYEAGLPADKFKWEEMDSDECKNAEKRSHFLLISFNIEGELKTTNGKRTATKDNSGPTMLLSDSEEHGMLNIIANYAHEMGHAWGLLHEHQNAAFWHSELEPSDTLFSTKSFHCENLVDYQKVLKILKDTKPGTAEAEMAVACKRRSGAKVNEFSATEYLPFEANEVSVGSKKKVDWRSIMLYPTGAGGIVEEVNGVKTRKPVLTKPNGDPIPINLIPSPKDVEGLKTLYGIKPDSTWNPFGSKGSVFRNKFNIIRRKDPDSGC